LDENRKTIWVIGKRYVQDFRNPENSYILEDMDTLEVIEMIQKRKIEVLGGRLEKIADD